MNLGKSAVLVLWNWQSGVSQVVMPLEKCSDCGYEHSISVVVCPKCGKNIKLGQQNLIVLWMIIVGAGLFLIYGYYCTSL